MKILHITNYYRERYGYQENCLPRFQQKLGHDVLVITSDYAFPTLEHLNTMQSNLGERNYEIGDFFDDTVRIVRTKSRFRSIKRPGIISFPVAKVLKEYSPDIVHIHSATNLAIPELCLRQKKYKYKIFIDNHQDDSVSNYTNSLMERSYYGIWRIFYHSLAFKKHVSKFLPITANSQEWLAKRLHISESQMSISPLGVDLETMIYDKAIDRKFRDDYKIGEKLIIVNAGKQYPKKRIDWVIDVAIAAKKMGVPVYLILVGNADPEYDTLINKKLFELGPDCLRLPLLERKDLRKIYCAADIGIWPGIPSITIQEAMACRVALVLPEDDIVGHLIDGNGLTESQDVNAAAQYIYSLYRDNELLAKHKLKSEEIVSQYSWKQISKDLLDIYSGHAMHVDRMK